MQEHSHPASLCKERVEQRFLEPARGAGAWRRLAVAAVAAGVAVAVVVLLRLVLVLLLKQLLLLLLQKLQYW